MRLEDLLCLRFAEDEGTGAKGAIVRIDFWGEGGGGAAILTGYDAGHFGEGAAILVGNKLHVVNGDDGAVVRLRDLVGSAAIGALELMGAGCEMEGGTAAAALQGQVLGDGLFGLGLLGLGLFGLRHG